MRLVDAEQLSTITGVAPDAHGPTDGSFTLAVTSGPDNGRRLVLDGASAQRVLVGQSEVCDLRLSDREVSRRHAALEHLGSSLRITDLGSTNGTFVDRVRVLDDALVSISSSTSTADIRRLYAAVQQLRDFAGGR